MHAFRDDFAVGQREGFALEFDDAHSRAAAAAPFFAHRHDGGQLRVTVFETAEAAEDEKTKLGVTAKLTVRKVSAAEVRAFAAIGYFGVPARVFVRGSDGTDAPL